LKKIVSFTPAQESHTADRIVFNDKTKPVIAKPDAKVAIGLNFKFC
jgi:hypothetical protein